MCEPDANIFGAFEKNVETKKHNLESIVEKVYYDNEIKGKAILFNHFEYRDKSVQKRHGTHHDASRLKMALESLNFDVEICLDFTFKQIRARMIEVAKMKRTDLSCLIVVVMTHGNAYGLVNSFDEAYYVNNLWTMLKPEKCQGLIGIPKIFLIEACRGEHRDKGYVETDGSNGNIMKYPTMADFLQMYSSYGGYISWRIPSGDGGSWFIQSLCRILEAKGAEWHLLDLLTVLNNKVAFEHETSKGDKQIPQIVSMLTKLWKFRKSEYSAQIKSDSSRTEKKIQEYVETKI